MYQPSPISGHTFSAEDSARGGAELARRTWRDHIARAKRAQVIDGVIEAIEEGDIGQGAIEVLADILAKVQDGLDELPMESTLDAVRLASVMDTLHKMHRLANGQSTANVAHATVDPLEIEARRAALAARVADIAPTT